MRDPNDYIVIGVWFVALCCVMVIIGAFQSTGQASNTGKYTFNYGIEMLTDTYTIEETSYSSIKCDHEYFCGEGNAAIQFIGDEYRSPKKTLRLNGGAFKCVCFN